MSVKKYLDLFLMKFFLSVFPSRVLVFHKVTKQDSKQICTKPGSSHPFAEVIEGKDQRLRLKAAGC